MLKLVFRVQAIRRMFDRGISSEDVRHVLDTGSTIESYPEDTPYPSRLVLGSVGTRALHVVVADGEKEGQTVVITAYEPDFDSWDEEFRTRSKQ